MGYIPVVLLIRAFDNESYLSHLGSGADRLELQTESICRLRANIRMLVENRMVLRERGQIVFVRCCFPNGTHQRRNGNRKYGSDIYG